MTARTRSVLFFIFMRNGTYVRGLILLNQCDWCPVVEGFCSYIIMCKDGTMYKGQTNNLKVRMQEHWNGVGGKYTKGHPPDYLFHYEVFKTRKDAVDREKFYKKNTWWIKANQSKFNSIYTWFPPALYKKQDTAASA